MFKFIKSINSGRLVPEPITLKKSIYGALYAHSVYFLSGGTFNETAETPDQFIFIPLADAPDGTDKVVGFFATDDMLFETDYAFAGEDDEGTVGSPLYFNLGAKGNEGVISQNVNGNFYGGAYLVNKDEVYTRGKAIVLLRMADEPMN